MIIKNKTTKDLEQLKKENQIFIFNIHADWCGACEMLGAELQEIEKTNPEIQIFRSIVENEQEFVVENKIMGTPQTYIFANGEKVWDHYGFIPKEILLEVINKWKQ